MKNYDLFKAELYESFRDFNYGWNKYKQLSCDWILSRLVSGKVGVDVGGTVYLAHELLKRDVDITYFDILPPPEGSNISKFITNEMSFFLDSFAQGSLDFITTRHTLEHSTDPLFILWQFNKALKNGGKLFVIVPFHTHNWVWFYTHFSCLPLENWLMLFYRAGFKLIESDAGTWSPQNPAFIEHRFVLEVESRGLRLENK